MKTEGQTATGAAKETFGTGSAAQSEAGKKGAEISGIASLIAVPEHLSTRKPFEADTAPPGFRPWAELVCISRILFHSLGGWSCSNVPCPESVFLMRQVETACDPSPALSHC